MGVFADTLGKNSKNGKPVSRIVSLLAPLLIGSLGLLGVPAEAQLGRASSAGEMRTTEAAGAGSGLPEEGLIVLLGASYVRAWNIAELGGKKTVNRGVDGQQSFEILERFDKDVIPLKPRAVVIWGFINDIHRTERAKIDASIERTRRSIETMVEKAKENGIVPILVTEVTIRGKTDLNSLMIARVGKLIGEKKLPRLRQRACLKN